MTQQPLYDERFDDDTRYHRIEIDRGVYAWVLGTEIREAMDGDLKNVAAIRYEIPSMTLESAAKHGKTGAYLKYIRDKEESSNAPTETKGET